MNGRAGPRNRLRKRRALCRLQSSRLHVGLPRCLRVAFLRFRRLWRTGRFAPAVSLSPRFESLGDRSERARLGGCNCCVSRIPRVSRTRAVQHEPSVELSGASLAPAFYKPAALASRISARSEPHEGETIIVSNTLYCHAVSSSYMHTASGSG